MRFMSAARVLQVLRHSAQIEEISSMASNEATLEKMLGKVIELWQNTDLRLVSHVTGSAGQSVASASQAGSSAGTPNVSVSILTGADDILSQLEESNITIATIRGSRFITPIKVTLACASQRDDLYGCRTMT